MHILVLMLRQARTLVATLLFICSASLYAHSAVEDSLHQLNLLVDSSGTIKCGNGRVSRYRVRVWELDELDDQKTIYQVSISVVHPDLMTLQLMDTTSRIIPGFSQFLIKDMNFDGYPDIRLSTWQFANGGMGYSYYLFDRASRTFIYNRSFSALRSNITFDDSTKTIAEQGDAWSGGWPSRWLNRYKVHKNVLVRIETNYEQEWTKADGLSYIRIYRSKLVNGRTIVLKDTVELLKPN